MVVGHIELEPKFTTNDLTNLPNHQIYVKLTVDDAPSQPFSADTMRATDLARMVR